MCSDNVGVILFSLLDQSDPRETDKTHSNKIVF